MLQFTKILLFLALVVIAAGAATAFVGVIVLGTVTGAGSTQGGLAMGAAG